MDRQWTASRLKTEFITEVITVAFCWPNTQQSATKIWKLMKRETSSPPPPTINGIYDLYSSSERQHLRVIRSNSPPSSVIFSRSASVPHHIRKALQPARSFISIDAGGEWGGRRSVGRSVGQWLAGCRTGDRNAWLWCSHRPDDILAKGDRFAIALNWLSLSFIRIRSSLIPACLSHTIPLRSLSLDRTRYLWDSQLCSSFVQLCMTCLCQFPST